MEKKRKLECDCGGSYSIKEIMRKEVLAEAYVCNKCGDIMLSREQAEKYVEKLNMKETTDQERKIIRIGSSMGITLPEKLKKYGMKIGKKVKLEAIDKKTIKITLI